MAILGLENEGERVDPDQVFKALSHPTRRHILIELAGPVSWVVPEFDTEELRPDGIEQDQFDTELFHVHYPHLADVGLIDWNRESNTITQGSEFRKVRPVIEAIDSGETALPIR